MARPAYQTKYHNKAAIYVVLITLFVFAVVLFVALIVFETMMNQGNTDMTAEMSKATYPLMQMKVASG